MSSKSVNLALKSFMGLVEDVPFVSLEQMELMNIFKDVSSIPIPAESDLLVWDYAISLMQIKKVRIGSKFLIPSICPDGNVPPDWRFLSNSFPGVYELEKSIQTNEECRIQFKALGCIVPLDDAEGDPPFSVGSSYICKLPAKFYFLLINVDTPLGVVLDRVGVEDPDDSENYNDGDEVAEAAMDSLSDTPPAKRLRVSSDSTLSPPMLSPVVSASSSALVSESHDVAAAGASEKSVPKGKWVIYDLDGRPWHTRAKDECNKILKHSNLFRLLSVQRVKSFLCDLHFSLTLWKTKLFLHKRISNITTAGNNFPSLSRIRNIENLVVWKNDTLLEDFLFSRYNAFNWNHLSLAKFLPSEDSSVVWGRDSTDYGRSKLCLALTGLELMCYVNFDECFLGVFDSVIKFLINTISLDDYQDIFIRFQLELILHTFFHDVSSQSVSSRFPEAPMSSPRECKDLLVMYLQTFIDGILTHDHQPHFKFFGTSGDFKEITLDPITAKTISHTSSMAPLLSRPPPAPTPSPLLTSSSLPPPSSSISSSGPSGSAPPTLPALVLSSHGSRGKRKGSHSTTDRDTREDDQKPLLCAFWLGDKCNGSLDGKRMKCTSKSHSSINHPQLSTVNFQEALSMIHNLKWSDHVKQQFKDCFYSNRRRFANA
jgi:hypothetical protein